MALAGKGHRAAFEAECLPLMRGLYAVAVRLTRKPDDASDVVQETLLRAYRTFQNFEPGTNARAWLLKILYSVFLNRNRKERRSADWLPLESVEERLPAGSSAGSARFSAAELESALQSLPEAFRIAILLVDVEGLSYEEAAAALACPVGTVRSRLHRARAMMLDLLQPSPDSRRGRPPRGSA
jgi:RNA polymerase sigma-70 factor (ECF subfamily)